MAVWGFTERMLAGETLDVFGQGELARDFTYIDDIVEGILRVFDLPDDPASPARIFNIGRGEPVTVNRLIELLEARLGVPASRRGLQRNPSEAVTTHASIDRLMASTGYRPTVALEEGLDRFVSWYQSYRGV